MRLIKPTWIQMDSKADYPIYCVDINPDNTTLAIGGQGESSGRIKLFKISFLDEKNEISPEEILICQLDNVTKCVNCLRWSHSGRFLASGDDQHHLKIWRSSKTSKSYQMYKMMVGHRGDILDLNWSPNDVFIATASVDNTVIIWDAFHWSGQIQVIRGHKGFVKGVSWDPLGHFLASQCDDRSVRIWRTSTWEHVVSIKKPFKDCHSSTHALRLCWVADGGKILSAHAMNNSAHTAQFIERETWAISQDVVGHRRAVSVVSTNPYMFSREGHEDATYFVIGSRDRSISIWQTNLVRPLFVVHDLFANSISDISWSPSGYQFVCSSIDGSIGFFNFDVSELGKKLPRPISIESECSIPKVRTNLNQPKRFPNSEDTPAKNGRRRIPLTFLGSFDSDDEVTPNPSKHLSITNDSENSQPVQLNSTINEQPLENCAKIQPKVTYTSPDRSPPPSVYRLKTYSYLFQVVNDKPQLHGDSNYYSCTLADSEGKALWQSFTTSPCISAGISKTITAVLGQDSTLFVFLTPFGNLIALLCLSVTIHSVFCVGDIVIAVSPHNFTSWDMQKKICLVNEGRLPDNMINDSSVKVNEIGMLRKNIYITLSSGKSYLYLMATWQPIFLESNMVVSSEKCESTDLLKNALVDCQIKNFQAEVLFLKDLVNFSATKFLNSWKNLLLKLTCQGDEKRLKGLIGSVFQKKYFYTHNFCVHNLDPAELVLEALDILKSNLKLSQLHDYFEEVISFSM